MTDIPKRQKKTTFNIAAAAVLNCWKLLFWSRDLCLHVTLHLLSNIRTHRLICRRDIAKKRFSIWRPSAILNFWKLSCWPRDIYPHVILHLWSKFRINRPIWRRDMAKTFSIWRPSAILNLQNLDLLSNICPENWNLRLHTKFDRNLIIHSWDIEIKLFSKWWPSAVLF